MNELSGRKGINRGRLIFFVLLFFLSVYLFTAQGHLGYNKDGYIRFLVSRNIVEKGALDFSDKEQIKEYGGWLFKGRGGRLYPAYEIGQSLFFIPLYVVGKAASRFFPAPKREHVVKLFCSFLNPVLAAVLCAVFMLFLLRLGFSGKVSFLATLILGLGTMLWPESRDTYNHIQAAVFMLLSFLFGLRPENRKPYLSLFFSGFFLGAAFLTRLDSALAFPGLSLLIIAQARTGKLSKYSIFLSGLLPAILVFFYYNYIRFTDVFHISHINLAGSYFSYPSFSRIWVILFSPGKGFFIYSPVLIIALACLKEFYLKNKTLASSFYLTCLLYLLFLMSFPFWSCPYSWGPRYLVVAVALLAVLLAGPLKNFSELPKWQRCCMLGLLILSISVQFVAASTFHMKYYVEMSAGKFPFRELQDSFWSLKYSPIVRHFLYFLDAVRNTFVSFFSASTPAPLRDAPALNLLDWWWVLIFQRGIKAALLAPFLLVSLSAFSLAKIRRLLNQI